MNNQIKLCSMTKGEIYTEICRVAESGSYVSYIRGTRCTNEQKFFCEISASFQFPYYFGENWAAMDECLCDLEWINPSKVFIVVEDFSQLFSDQTAIMERLQAKVIKYFELMIHYWSENEISVEVWLNN